MKEKLWLNWCRYELSWEEGRQQETWERLSLFQYKRGKVNINECGSYGGISLLNIDEKVYGKLSLNGCRISERTINEEQGGFRRVRNSVDKIFPFRIITENCQWKQKKDYAVTLVLDKAYDRNDQMAMCNIYWRCLVWVGG